MRTCTSMDPRAVPALRPLATTVPGAVALLADGRFPSGGHAHSGGLEALLVRPGTGASVDDPDGAVWAFLRGRLATTGRMEAAFVAWCGPRIAVDALPWETVDAELSARIVSPALRDVSRVLGRQWLRAGARVWPSAKERLPDPSVAIHQVPAYAAVSTLAGLGTADAVRVHLHHLVAGTAGAAIRLRGEDPFAVQRAQTLLAPEIDVIVDEAVGWVASPLAELPACAGPSAELLAEGHARADLRLFRS